MRRLLLTLALLVLLPLAVLSGAIAAIVVQAPHAPVLTAPPTHAPLIAAARAFDADDPLLAIGYLGQVQEDSPDFSRAQRMIGYRAYSEQLGRPAEGLRFVLRALAAEPTSSNSWQDAARTFHALFFP